MSMTVVNKNSNEKYDVHDITYDKNGYPRFLIYKDNQWVRMSAKHFRPYTTDDAVSEFINKYKNMPTNYLYSNAASAYSAY